MGGGGTDTLNGDTGDDVLDGGTGNDTLHGQAGIDLADYSSRITAVTVSIDNAANDGAPAELDNVRDTVENVTGGTGNDTLLGGAPGQPAVRRARARLDRRRGGQRHARRR